MSRLTLKIVAGLLFLLGLYACFRAVAVAEEARWIAGLWSAKYELPQQPPPGWLEVSPKPEGCRFALYQEESREIEAPLFNRAKRLVTVTVAGDASLLFSPGRLTAGGYPDGNLPRGCLIDEKSALELWGTKDPIGFTVVLGGVEYEVAGVLKSARPLLAVNAGEDPEFTFTGILFRGGKEDAFPRRDFQQMLEGLSAALPQIDETGLLAGRLRFLALLPLWGMLLWGGWRCLRALPWVRRRRGLCAVIGAVLPIFFARLLAMPNIVTPEMLPTYWSDFSFWPKRVSFLLNELCAAWFVRGSMSGLLIHLEFVVPVLAYGILCAAAFWAAARVLFIGE